MPADAKAVTLERYYEYIDADQYDALFDLFSDDITYHRSGQPTLDGKPAFEQFYRDDRPLDDGSHTIHDYIVDDDRVCVQGRFDGTLHGDAVAFEFADIHRFDDDGLIEERWTYTDRGAV